MDWLVRAGQNRPICGGRWLMANDQGVWLTNIALFTGLATLFAMYVAYPIHISLVVITAILVGITFWSLCKATFTEAGQSSILIIDTPCAPPTTNNSPSTSLSSLMLYAARYIAAWYTKVRECSIIRTNTNRNC
jgi:hypothetical protein